MKEKYCQPVLLIQTFKIRDTVVAAGVSGKQCGTWICRPNGSGCFTNTFYEGCPANTSQPVIEYVGENQ